ncbi:DUF4242 domain-containing protein [Gaetbulibacter saemankumensis]|uniref:DUF4242 domain-containing protein n=1 Tax=Gaetbulibacter saemankumensis TaxID=311208 RepID=UPI0004109FE0|nr:DUF4242 domain-containing protein [Gaetbulibacter saemankumensis]
MKTLKSFLILILINISAITFGQDKSIADLLRDEAATPNQHMYVIEREMPEVGKLTKIELKQASLNSCKVLHNLGPDIKWVNSFITGNKIYCVYLAANKDLVIKHAKDAGIPANSVSEVVNIIDPSTAEM